MKKVLLALLVLVLSLSLIACGAGDEDIVESPDVENEEVAEEVESDALVDRAGFEFQEVTSTDSIVSLSPIITEILVEMGYGDNLVAVDGPQSQNKDGVPDDIVYMDMMAPDVEQLIALDPDLILISTMSMAGGDDPLQPVRDQGTSVVYIEASQAIDEIYKDISFIGQVLNDEEASQEIVENMKAQIEEIRERNADEEKKTGYFEVAAAPDMYSFGSGTYLNEMMEILGLENILADNEGWMSVSEEIILDRNPDVIFTNVDYIDNPVDEIISRDGWNSIKAVSNEDVYYIDSSASSLANHNIVRALLEMEEAVR